MYLPKLQARQYGYGYGDGYDNYGDSKWDNWGRWVLLVGVVIVVIIIFVVFSFITARRRRRAGARPMMGTGWMAPQHGNVNYYGNQPQQPYYSNTWQQPAPPYEGAPGGANQGYYGGQENGINLQSPSQAYHPQRGGDSVYPAPEGPPPDKKGIVR
ncbi:MAG: hypothetical protein M1828_006928 [Chrysothrix sp. TS-e1954]|nr:MAG: hypothetical protein M1828_006928 [Chrysothrix sp. TS-e1954]